MSILYAILGIILPVVLLGLAIAWFINWTKPSKGDKDEPDKEKPWQKFAKSPLGAGLQTALLLTVIYFTAIWLCYNFGAKWMQSSWGFTQRTSWVLVTLLGVGITVPAIWLLYSAANIPGDPKAVKKGMRTIAFAILAFFAYTYYAQPVEFFDSQSGQPVAQIDPVTNKLYHFPPGDSVRYSPETGEKLRPVTKEDVKRLNLVPKQSPGNLLEKAEATVKRWNTPRVDTVTLPLLEIPNTKGVRIRLGTTVYRIPRGDSSFRSLALITNGRRGRGGFPSDEILPEWYSSLERRWIKTPADSPFIRQEDAGVRQDFTAVRWQPNPAKDLYVTTKDVY